MRRRGIVALVALLVCGAGCRRDSPPAPGADLVGDWCVVEAVIGGAPINFHRVMRLRADESVEVATYWSNNPPMERHYYGRWSPQGLDYRFAFEGQELERGRLVPDAARTSLSTVDMNGAPIRTLTRAACPVEISFISQGFSDTAHRTNARHAGPRAVNPEVLTGDAAHPWAGDWCSLSSFFDARSGQYRPANEVVRIYPDGRMRRAFGPELPTDICSSGTIDPAAMTFQMAGCMVGRSGRVRLNPDGRALAIFYGTDARGSWLTRLDCADVEAAHLQAVAR